MFHFLSRIVSPTSPILHSLKFSSTTCSRLKKGNSFTVSYLIDTCGFSPERAASAAKHFSLGEKAKPDLVIQFFKNHGLSQTQVLSVLKAFPRYLLYEPEKSLKPKIEFFVSKGFSESDITKIMVSGPQILARSLQNEIVPCFDFFDNMFKCKDKLMKTVKRFSGILCDLGQRSEPNMKLLREEGVPLSHIIRMIEYYPNELMTPPKKFKEVVQEVKELGFNPLKLQFVVTIHVKLCISKSVWARKEGIYRKWGWNDDDISAVFRVSPWCMSVSESKIEAVMDFLVNKLGYESSAIAKFPVVLTMSLEKRIVPRGSVILVLLSKGLVTKKLSLGQIFKSNDIDFFNRFINCHVKEADELLKFYEAKSPVAS